MARSPTGAPVKAPARILAAGLAAAAACGAGAQVINGDFESGSLEPWQFTPTTWGGTTVFAVVQFDMDGPGPRSPGHALIMHAGQTASSTGYQGGGAWQAVALEPGMVYRASALWATVPGPPVSPVTAGRFELLIDGEVKATVEAPPVITIQETYGVIEAEFTAGAASAVLMIRVTRPASRLENVFQYIDDVVIAPAVPVCVADFNLSGGTPDDADVAAFFGAWAEGDARADVNASGGTPDDADVSFFFDRWTAGC